MTEILISHVVYDEIYPYNTRNARHLDRQLLVSLIVSLKAKPKQVTTI